MTTPTDDPVTVAALAELESRPLTRSSVTDHDFALCVCGAGVADFRFPQHAASCQPLRATCRAEAGANP